MVFRLESSAFFASLFLSRLADQMLLFLVPLVVYQTTGSASWSGMAFFVESLPRFIAFPVCGILCDRHSPLSLLQYSQVWRAVACAAVLAAWSVAPGIGWLMLLSAVCGVLTTQGFMAREVMLPHLFSVHSFEKVLAYSQIAEQAGMVSGPLLAGWLLTHGTWQQGVVAAAVLFLAADGGTVLWRRRSRVRFAPPPSIGGWGLQPFRIALHHIWRLPELQRIITLAAGVNLIVGITLATSAAMLTGALHGSRAEYAALQTAGAVATIAVLFFVAHARLSLAVLGLCGFLAILAGAVLTAQTQNVGLYASGFVLICGFDKMFNIYLRSLRQRVIPPRDFGKTAGVVTLLNNLTQPLAGLLVGVGAHRFGLPVLILSSAVCMGGLGLLALLARSGR
ncbi:MFS transporter [Paludibacterium yongneupense]|uniref:MFS transporter n=1 Tax=Paludibacterium yongneupense TaxID=400061 RepID=UPI000427899C|nr:MFS transporter [Paludibacterium yongneupense]